MHSRLIVMTFEGRAEAAEVYESLLRMRTMPLPDPEDVAVLTRDSRGRMAVTQKRLLDRTRQIRVDRLLSSAITLLFDDTPDELVQILVQKGFDDFFRRQVRERMGDNCSALAILIRSGQDFDRGRLFGILSLFNGQVFETTLPPKVEVTLTEGWEA
jgi:uncharacterized membrane protein